MLRISVHPAWRAASSSMVRTSAIFWSKTWMHARADASAVSSWFAEAGARGHPLGRWRTSLVFGGGRPFRAEKYASSGVDQEAAYEWGSYGGPQVSEKAMLKSPATIASLKSSFSSSRRVTLTPIFARSARMSSSSTSRLASPSSTMKSTESSRHAPTACSRPTSAARPSGAVAAASARQAVVAAPTVMVAAQGGRGSKTAGWLEGDGWRASGGEQCASLFGEAQCGTTRAACVCFIFCGRIVRAACAPHRGTDVHDRDRQTRRHLRMAECKRLRAPHRIA